VRRVEGVGNLPGDPRASVTGSVPWQALGQRRSFDELQYQRVKIVGVLETVDGADVRMIEGASIRASRSKRPVDRDRM